MQSLAKAAAIVALAPQLAFRSNVAPLNMPNPDYVDAPYEVYFWVDPNALRIFKIGPPPPKVIAQLLQ